MHYKRKRRSGTLESSRSNTEAMRAFFEAAVLAETDDCILWPFGKDAQGYGLLTLDGLQRTANYHVCTRVYGPSDGRVSCHRCPNKACINKQHLRWGTRADNVADAVTDGATARGERNGHALLTKAAVLDIRSRRQTAKEAAATYGVSVWTIFDARRGRNWSHV